MDSELLSRAQQGDSPALEALVERYRDNLYGFARWMTRSETDAAEIVQEAFLSACLRLRDFATESEFGAWAHWIAASHPSIRWRLRHIADAVIEDRKTPRFHAATLAQDRSPDWGGDSDRRTTHPELRRLIEDATGDLPQSHREVFLLRDVAGLSYEQIAHITGGSISAIKDHLHQARLSLRNTIDQFYRER